jgi:hypothetical protein
MAAVDQHVSDLKALRAGDVLSIRTTLIGIKDRSLRFCARDDQ